MRRVEHDLVGGGYLFMHRCGRSDARCFPYARVLVLGALRKLLMDQWRDLPSAAAGCVVSRQQPTRCNQRRNTLLKLHQGQAATCSDIGRQIRRKDAGLARCEDPRRNTTQALAVGGCFRGAIKFIGMWKYKIDHQPPNVLDRGLLDLLGRAIFRIVRHVQNKSEASGQPVQLPNERLKSNRQSARCLLDVVEMSPQIVHYSEPPVRHDQPRWLGEDQLVNERAIAFNLAWLISRKARGFHHHRQKSLQQSVAGQTLQFGEACGLDTA